MSSKVSVLWVVGSWSKSQTDIPFTSMENLWIQNSCSKQFTLSIRTVSTEQLRIDVINSSWQKKKKDTSEFTLDNKILTVIKSDEVELLVSPPTQTSGSRISGDVLSFQALEKKIQLTQLCQKVFFQHLVLVWKKKNKIRSDGDDGWEEITPLCREYTSSRFYSKFKALSVIPEGGIIGAVLEVHVVKILDGYRTEVAIQSIALPENTSYIIISREEERFINEIHDHKKELRPGSELLASLQDPGRSAERKIIRSHKETWTSPSTRETCADPIILTPKVSLFTKRTIPTNEKKWKVNHNHSRNWGYLEVSVSKMNRTMLRHFDDGFWLRLIHDDSIKKQFEYCQDKDGIYDIPEVFRHTLMIFQ